MQTRYTFRHMDTAPALQSYMDDKIDRLQKFDDTLMTADVTFTVEKRDQIVEVTLKTKGQTLNAVHKSEDMYASCDMIFEKLERQLRRHKEKLKSHH